VKRVLRFRSTGRVDIILTTSLARKLKEGGGKAAVARDLAPEGDVHAIAEAVSMLSRNYRQKRTLTHVSERVNCQLDDDLIILGSVASNRYSEDFLNRFRLAREFGIDINVAECRLNVRGGAGASPFSLDDFDIERGRDNLPRRDIGYIMVGANPYNPSRRAIVCAGYTTYGTGAVGEILFSQILTGNESRHRRLRKVLGKRSAFIVLECGLNLGGLVHWSELYSVGMD
jgi:hypothetical protein